VQPWRPGVYALGGWFAVDGEDDPGAAVRPETGLDRDTDSPTCCQCLDGALRRGTRNTAPGRGTDRAAACRALGIDRRRPAAAASVNGADLEKTGAPSDLPKEAAVGRRQRAHWPNAANRPGAAPITQPSRRRLLHAHPEAQEQQGSRQTDARSMSWPTARLGCAAPGNRELLGPPWIGGNSDATARTSTVSGYRNSPSAVATPPW